jgi:hypothetical protein
LVILCNAGIEKLVWGIDGNVTARGKTKNSETANAKSFDIYLTLTSLQFNPVLWCQKPDSKFLSHGTPEEDVLKHYWMNGEGRYVS